MKFTCIAVASLALAGSAFAAGRLDLVETALRAGKAKYVPNELLVQFKPGVSLEAQASALGFVRGSMKEALRVSDPQDPREALHGDLHLMTLPANLSVADAVRSMSQLADVEYAEPNWIYRHQAVSNDPYATNGSLWGMASATTQGGLAANRFGSGASTAWANNKTNCGGVYIGIIDEGYMFNHQDLAANAGKNPGEIAGNGRDDDGNGYVDDVYGWDFAGNNSSVFDGASDDHGTHVAGTIAGAGGNGVGVAGVCWSGVKLMGAKFLGSSGGTTANAIKAVDYFTNLKTRQKLNLPATNNSWGGGGYSQALYDAIQRANNAGILFVAAAGNSSQNCDASDCFPAEYNLPNVISVASITNTGAMSSFSNYGATTVDIGAPGSGIWSTVPTSSGGSGYSSMSGTSMAAPHVSGAVALYKARNPSATAAQIKAAILNSATPTSSLSGRVVTGGRLNVSGF
jgi:subtilisin family serine protease